MIANIKGFFNEVSKEMKKVSWPTREQLRESTAVVAVTCVLISLFVWLIDLSMTLIMKNIY
ncbi:MAG: preprotein translocase subunit SecE [Candidatus Kapabacteria bacterium]|nr:preprotein translocase subunit SecE [Candidatus Kapabacteria bacterium]MBX7153331.1 preprotein translocase subunit SecE [Bacteroidota bacterium]